MGAKSVAKKSQPAAIRGPQVPLLVHGHVGEKAGRIEEIRRTNGIVPGLTIGGWPFG
jgi:Icc-related predicted phosphoesterase